MDCPECGERDFYQPLIGKGECLNLECSLFSKRHYDLEFKAVKIEKKIELNNPKVDYFDLAYGDGWMPYPK